MLSRLSWQRVAELWRFYQAGIINTVFGVAAYSALVGLGLNMFIAQLISHLMGMTFNYFTYQRFVFRSAAPAKTRFIVSYGMSYLLSLATLGAISQVIISPYVAGIAAAGIVSLVNYFALKHFVFSRSGHG